MTESTEAQPAPEQPAAASASVASAAPPRGSRRWKAVAFAAVAGLAIGGGIGAGTMASLNDPTDSGEYQSLEQELRAAERNNESAASEAAESSPAAPSTSADNGPEVGEVGQAMSNRGVTLTVTAARVADVIELNKSNYQQGSGFETYTPTPPDTGGKFVIVETHVVNNAQVSMDLTCGYPIATALVDDRDRQFDPIDSLHEIRANPDCNAQLPPGFEDDMTYIFMVPTDAQIVGFAFSDATALDNSSAYTGIRLML